MKKKAQKVRKAAKKLPRLSRIMRAMEMPIELERMEIVRQKIPSHCELLEMCAFFDERPQRKTGVLAKYSDAELDRLQKLVNEMRDGSKLAEMLDQGWKVVKGHQGALLQLGFMRPDLTRRLRRQMKAKKE